MSEKTGVSSLASQGLENNDDAAMAMKGTPRRTRLSFELHLNAFENMWIEREELSLDDDV